MNLNGQKVAILGAGRSGRAAARLALRHGGEVTLYDAADSGAFEGVGEGLECHPRATVKTGRSLAADLVVTSPGIETDGEFARSFADGAGEFIGETEFAARYYGGIVVGITGTNGKTTTTELVEAMMSSGGVTCAACGNYGRPLADVVLGDEHPEAISLELSSFQLETISSFRPDVAVWLNFSPDHMDRYRTVGQYRAAKLRIFENQGPDDTAVIRLGEDLGELRARRINFSATDNGGEYELMGTAVLSDGEKVIDLQSTKLRGVHNAENVMAALAAVQAVGISQTAATEALAGYAPPLHRCELVRVLDGVEYINDSKATNLHALEAALLSQSRPTILIAGGKQKGLDYEPLLPLLTKVVREVVVFGEIRKELAALCSQSVTARIAESLGEAVALACGAASHGTTVLFSPGTSSFDMFAGYEERGEAFRTAVQALK